MELKEIYPLPVESENARQINFALQKALSLSIVFHQKGFTPAEIADGFLFFARLCECR